MSQLYRHYYCALTLPSFLWRKILKLQNIAWDTFFVGAMQNVNRCRKIKMEVNNALSKVFIGQKRTSKSTVPTLFLCANTAIFSLAQLQVFTRDAFFVGVKQNVNH